MGGKTVIFLVSEKVIGLTVAMLLSLCFSLLGMLAAYLAYRRSHKVQERSDK